MKISRDWLQTFFETPLPDSVQLGNALTFHAFEIESIDPSTMLGAGNDYVLDVKVTPNRGHDCFSYQGIAKEISAILKIPLRADLTKAQDLNQQFSMEMPVTVTIQRTDLCNRYIAWTIQGVKVGPSPKWLVDRLASMGQHSINNVVDATNFVMFNLGQPLHAFDAGKLKERKGAFAISVRDAHPKEKFLALDKKEYVLSSSMLVIADGHSDAILGIAGVKGGEASGITEETTDIILESANFDGVSVRKTAAGLKLRTDASVRFEQVISPELAGEGIREAAKLILELAGGTLAGFADVYTELQEKKVVSVSLEKITKVLGVEFAGLDIEAVFTRLGFESMRVKDVFSVTIPSERLDIMVAEDLIEEVGRIIGYDNVPAILLPKTKKQPAVNANFYAAEKAREAFASKGYSEVITSVFAERGERVVLNKVDGVRPFLRDSFAGNLAEARTRAMQHKELLGLKEVNLFEIGTVWRGGKEEVLIASADKKGLAPEEVLKPVSSDGYEDLPTSSLERYQSFSKYPSIVRDIALWVPAETKDNDVRSVILHHAGALLMRIDKFDEFKKGEKTSYAFRLVFQSFDRTLFDGDANERMESIYIAVKEKGWEVR